MAKYELICGDAMESLKAIPERTFQTCITSPPYFGLRDYGIDKQIGLEETPDAYVERLVQTFREVKRTLKDDGTLWLNLGDSYYNYRPGLGQIIPKQSVSNSKQDAPENCPRRGNKYEDFKEKDLMGIPWMVAFALRKDGWYLRQDIIWSKPNPMPESVKDRCTKSHEYIFLFTKSQKYYYDSNAVMEEASGVAGGSCFGKQNQDVTGTGAQQRVYDRPEYEKRNRRSVWSITTQSFPEAHFATFPPELPEICLKAGSREGDTVLDPFNGAGTTGVACIKWKRCYIGIELNPKYVEMSRTRLDNADDRFATPLFDFMDTVERENNVEEQADKGSLPEVP